MRTDQQPGWSNESVSDSTDSSSVEIFTRSLIEEHDLRRGKK